MKTPKQIIEAINADHGLSDAEISRRVGCSQPTIWRLRSGASTDCASLLYMKLRDLIDGLQAAKLGAGETAQEDHDANVIAATAPHKKLDLSETVQPEREAA